MPNEALLQPVSEDEPCGPDMRWEPECQALSQQLETLVNQESAISDAEVVAGDQHQFEELIFEAEKLCKKTKDIGIFAVYAEARWRDQGLVAFADAMTDFVAAM